MLTPYDKYEIIVVGAGISGPAVATGFARQGRRVLLVERDWNESNGIAGDVLQPGGVRALKSLGMGQAINHIDGSPYKDVEFRCGTERVKVPMPLKKDLPPLETLDSCVYKGNDKVLDDENFDAKDFEESEHEKGIMFKHGRLVMNLRKIAKTESNVTTLQGLVTKLVMDGAEVRGVVVKTSDGKLIQYDADLTIVCDGKYSRLRKALPGHQDFEPQAILKVFRLLDVHLIEKETCHILFNEKMSPVIIYPSKPTEITCICCLKPREIPDNLDEYFRSEVANNIPVELQKAFRVALVDGSKTLTEKKWRSQRITTPGVQILGDALNKRDTLGGLGMTMAFCEVVLILKCLEGIPSFSDRTAVKSGIERFLVKRKKRSLPINLTSSILGEFLGNLPPGLKVGYQGFFCYMKSSKQNLANVGYVLSGMSSYFDALSLFSNIIIASIRVIFTSNGLLLWPLSVVQAIAFMATAIKTFFPIVYKELCST